MFVPVCFKLNSFWVMGNRYSTRYPHTYRAYMRNRSSSNNTGILFMMRELLLSYGNFAGLWDMRPVYLYNTVNCLEIVQGNRLNFEYEMWQNKKRINRGTRWNDLFFSYFQVLKAHSCPSHSGSSIPSVSYSLLSVWSILLSKRLENWFGIKKIQCVVYTP